MAKGRFWITIVQTGNRHHRDQHITNAQTLAIAEGRAQALLRVYRLSKVDGPAWDRWTVATSAGPMSLPRIVAYGDHLTTAFTERDHGWRD
jgi:hypothetical protein